MKIDELDLVFHSFNIYNVDTADLESYFFLLKVKLQKSLLNNQVLNST